MTWFDWALVGFWTLGTLLVVLTVGQPRKPITPGLAAWILVVNSLWTLGLLWTRGAIG